MRQLTQMDRVGLGWRKPLGPAILSHADEIDVIEVIIDDYFHASQKELRALKTLACQIPVLYHGVSLGLASSHPVDEKRLSHLARTLGALDGPEWSEHLAFVRAGGREIGHLAAPPRTEATIEGAFRNLQRIERVVGSRPHLENIASLINPPGSTLSEPAWIEAIAMASQSTLLLDLHNLYANALNRRADPLRLLVEFPLSRVRLVHLSGGKWISEPPAYARSQSSRRLLDDHVHDVPDAVYGLLRTLATETPHPLTVIIERDGEYPHFQSLIEQLRRARLALSEGRALRAGRRNGGINECAGP